MPPRWRVKGTNRKIIVSNTATWENIFNGSPKKKKIFISAIHFVRGSFKNVTGIALLLRNTKQYEDLSHISLQIFAKFCQRLYRWWKHSWKAFCESLFSSSVALLISAKAVPLQARKDREGSGKLRFPDFVTKAQDGGRLSVFTSWKCSWYSFLLTLQRGMTGTARMLHALTHSSISRQVREQM